MDTDDGTTAAAALTTGALACSFDDSKKRTWAEAAGADASAAPIAWITRTTTCDGRERVWVVGGSGSASVGRTDLAASLGFYALCIR